MLLKTVFSNCLSDTSSNNSLFSVFKTSQSGGFLFFNGKTNVDVGF